MTDTGPINSAAGNNTVVGPATTRTASGASVGDARAFTSELYHPSALVVAQFLKETVLVKADAHITELYPNSYYQASKEACGMNFVNSKLSQPWRASSTSLRGLLFADNGYAQVKDVSYNIYSVGAWCVAGDLSDAHFDLREHVLDRMQSDIKVSKYNWDAACSIALEKMLVSLTSFSQMHCNRKASLTWHEILRILDAGDDVLGTPSAGQQSGTNAGPTGVYESTVRQLTGRLRSGDTIVLSFVFRNPHPKIKDIDLRLIFQCNDNNN